MSPVCRYRCELLPTDRQMPSGPSGYGSAPACRQAERSLALRARALACAIACAPICLLPSAPVSVPAGVLVGTLASAVLGSAVVNAADDAADRVADRAADRAAKAADTSSHGETGSTSDSEPARQFARPTARASAGVPAGVPNRGEPARDGHLCVYVSSYHEGYSWSDGLERGLREGLGDHCEIVQFDMDTKRNRESEHAAQAGLAAYELIQRLRPDVVITSDDNAAKHLIVPYLMDSATPVVFSGVNWTVEEYGFPAGNVTGIVEIAPIRPMIREALALVPETRTAAYIGALTLTELKNYERIRTTARSFGISLDSLLVETFDQWKSAFTVSQQYDFVVSGSYSGIADWDLEHAAEHARASTQRPCLTSHEWMMPVCVVGYTKLPEEHGELAAAAAIALLKGIEARDIPLLTNRKWDTWLNIDLAGRLDVIVPERLVRRAKQAGT